MRKKLNILKAKEKGRIYTLVIHNSIRLAVIVLILAAVFGGVGWILMPQKVEPAGIKKLIRRVNSAENDDYSSINTVKLLGRNGYFEITDNKANVLFTSDSQHKNTYNKDILQYLPLVDTDVVYDLLPLENGEKQGSLLVRHTEDQLTGIAMLDENGKIMYSNLNLKNSQISSETMDYLFYKVDSSNLFIQKYEFLNSKGERRYLLIHSNSDSAGMGPAPARRTASSPRRRRHAGSRRGKARRLVRAGHSRHWRLRRLPWRRPQREPRPLLSGEDRPNGKNTGTDRARALNRELRTKPPAGTESVSLRLLGAGRMPAPESGTRLPARITSQEKTQEAGKFFCRLLIPVRQEPDTFVPGTQKTAFLERRTGEPDVKLKVRAHPAPF